MKRHEESTAFVLDRNLAGESFIRLQLFCPVAGLRAVLQRATSSRSRVTPVADFLDLAEFDLESTGEQTAFVRDCRILRSHTDIARHLDGLRYAARFAHVLIENRLPPESAPGVFQLLDRITPAFAAGQRTECVYFKALFLLLRDEGLPVREDWASSLGLETREALHSILALPLAAQTSPPAQVLPLIAQLETWAVHNHDFRFPRA